MIALAGSHRVGKTTLAKAFAEKHGWTFAETSVSAIFKELGHSPSDTFDFTTRLDIQEEILKRLNEFYRVQQDFGAVITDRSPIDMLAYTMAEASGTALTPEDQVRFKKYADDCFESTNRWFSLILVVQPGIPLAEAEGKAALSEGYIEHLNTLCLGLVNDERLKVAHFYVPRRRLDIDKRIQSVEVAIQRGLEQELQNSVSWQSRAFH